MESPRNVVLAYLSKVSEDPTDEKIRAFLKENPEPSDDQIHELAGNLGEDKHKFEERIYKMLGRCLKTAMDNKQLTMGKEVEKEHGDAYLLIQKKLGEKGVEMPISEDQFYEIIAAAHLNELPDYYTRLKKMEGDSHKEAMDFSSIAPMFTPDKKMDARETARALRLAIAAEHDAAHLYELMADSCESKAVAELLQDIADEEKVHVGELQWLLSHIDKDNGRLLQEGIDEAREELE